MPLSALFESLGNAKFTGPGGADPVDYIVQIEKALRPTAGDLLYAGELFRSSMIQRTMRGVDADGAQFAPYSEKYKARKEKELGNADAVTLFGYQHHPHMLNAIQVRAAGAILDGGETASAMDSRANAQPAAAFYVGFWDPETALRARVHNEGASIRTRQGTGKKQDHIFGFGVMSQKKGGKLTLNMPRRRFFAASPQELELIAFGIGQRIDMRMAALGVRH